MTDYITVPRGRDWFIGESQSNDNRGGHCLYIEYATAEEARAAADLMFTQAALASAGHGECEREGLAGRFARAICESEGRSWLGLDNSRDDCERWFRAGAAAQALADMEGVGNADPA